jgi:hypothetical protein
VKTHCARDHEFTPENTYTAPNGKRQCRACRKLWRNAPRREVGVLVHNGSYARKAMNVTVRCPGCLDLRSVTARTERRIRTKELSGLCQACATPPTVEVTDDLKAWWTERFTDAELHVLAAGLLDITPEHRQDVRERLPRWRTRFPARAPVTSELIKEAA